MTLHLPRRRRRLLIPLASLLCSLCFLSFDARAAWRTAGDVTAATRQPNGATFTLSSGARVSITFVALDVVRVRFAPTGVFERDQSYAVAPELRPALPGEATWRVDKSYFELGMMNTFVVVRRRPFRLQLIDKIGRVIVEDDAARPVMFDVESGAVQASKRRDHLEFYYGFGEKALPSARNGRTMTMWNTDTYAYSPGLDPIYQSIPFFIALRQGQAYGLFLDNTSRTFFDMGNTAPERYTFGAESGELDYYIFTGGSERTPASVVRDYTALTGRMPLPPLWSLGFQQSRYSYFPEARVREVARGLREHRIPSDVLYLDIDYMDGYRVFTWDRERFPDPPRMLRDLRAEGFRTVVIIDPGIKVDENYHAYREGRAGGFFVKTAEGAELRERVWPGVCAFPDFTDPKARAWFGSLYRRHLDEGISGFWNDMNEPGTFGAEQAPPQPRVTHDPTKTFPLNARHAGDGRPGTHARYHNVYGMQMARSTFEGLRELRPQERPFVLTRAGYAGIQRYSAVWTGDNVASWEHLQLSIAMLTGLSVSGVPFVGADVGGFSGDATPELYARWLQAAALTPFFRSHVEKGRQDREPWSFGAEVERISRSTIELRYRLLPYLYTLFREHEETGAPPMRPLWFNYPDDYATYNPTPSTEQFMLGRDLLVAPVMIPGEVRRVVYFPRGDSWLDWWTGARYEGGSYATVDAPLERLPLFVRVGATIPAQPVVQHTGEMLRAPLSLIVALGAQPSGEAARTQSAGRNVSRLYEDAGEGFDYRRGAFRTLAVALDGNSIRLSRSGAYNVSRPLSAVELLGLAASPRELRIDGRRIENFNFDAATRRLSLPLPAENVEEISVVP